MQPICEPDIDIDDHGARSDGLKSGFGQRHRMLAQGAIKIVVKEDTILPQGWLVIRGHGNCRLNEPTAALDLGSCSVSKECEGAAGYSAGLFCYVLVSHAADRQTHATEPDAHAAAQFDLTGAGANRLAL